MKRLNIFLTIVLGVVLVLGYYFTFMYSVEYTPPAKIEISSESTNAGPVTKVGWPRNWKSSGIANCFCDNHGEPYTSVDKVNLFINACFWIGIPLSLILVWRLSRRIKR